MLRKRRSGRRRGRVVDKAYLAWLHTRPGALFSGPCHSVHHVRFCGSQKDDTRALPLEAGGHQVQEGANSIESLGKAKFQEFWHIDLEAAIAKYQRAYMDDGHVFADGIIRP